MTSRREVLKLGVVGAASLTGVAASGDEPTQSTSLITRSQLAAANMPMPYTALFRRPPELVPYQTGFDGGDPARPFARYALTQKLGQARFVPGLYTTVAGYNGIFPGPTIRVPQGTRTEVRIRNALPSTALLHSGTFKTVTHLHGSASLPQYDGYANDSTAPGKFKNYHYPNWQNARTLWYHDHHHLVTAQGVYSGLAAMYPLSDRFERAQLPQGEFDVPLIISDALFNADGSLGYNDNDHDGLWGDIIMVNGVPWPLHEGQTPHLPLPGARRLDHPLLPARPLQRGARLYRGHRRRHGAQGPGRLVLAPGNRRALRDPHRLPQVPARTDSGPAEPEQQEQPGLPQYRQNHAVRSGAQLGLLGRDHLPIPVTLDDGGSPNAPAAACPP